MSYKNISLVIIALTLLFSCNKDQKEAINKFSDPTLVKIYDFKDKRLSDSLYTFFTNESNVYKTEAILAFASIQDTSAIERLGKLLTRETDATVRKALAFSIGQTPSRQSERILLGAIIGEKNPEVLREMLEAYGKTTTHWQLIQAAYVEDTIKAQGLAWSIYRAGFKGKTDTTANRIAETLLDQSHSTFAQLGAAHFFSRSAVNFEKAFNKIVDVAKNDRSSDVRMAAVSALRKINTPQSFEVMKSVLESDRDDRVKTNAVRALQNFEFNDTKSLLYKTLYDKHANLAIAASEVIKEKAQKEHWIELSNITGRIQHWRVRSNLYEAALKAGQNESLKQEILSTFKASTNPYEKAALLTALQSKTDAFDFLVQQLNADTPVVRVTAGLALASMHKNQNFNASLKNKYFDAFKEAVASGDAALIGVLAEPFSNPAYGYQKIVSDFSVFKDAQGKLSLPKDNESMQPLEAALAYFENRKPSPVENEYNHPINWELVKSIPKNQQAIIKTSRGHIKIQLFVEEAPGSVANFIELANNHYFDKKLFHRVVPNFVIQAGCNRGDGYGSEDYSIRSEFSHRRYKSGSVGMASAGKDTEGTQWFITHSPTPHLDGRYTIFAEVVEGMNTVELIEVGDQILNVKIVESK